MTDAEYIEVTLFGGLLTKIDRADFEQLDGAKLYRTKGGLHGGFYACIRHKNGRRVALHRIVTGAKPGQHVDHINGDTLDNRRCNLRLCEHRENARNSKKRRHSQQPYKGIVQRRGGWNATIVLDGVEIRTCLLPTPELAARVYDAMALRYHGEFARYSIEKPSVEDASDLLEMVDYVRYRRGIIPLRRSGFTLQKRVNGALRIQRFPTLAKALTTSRRWDAENGNRWHELF